MGLDIYLYHATEDLKPWREKQEEYEKKSEKMWKEAGEYDDLTDEERDAVSKKTDELAKSLGLDEWGSVPDHIEEGVNEPSKIHPDHMFTVGYFRSSYNSGGMNSVFRDLGVPDLYDIFGKDNDEYMFTPDWEASKERARLAIEQLKKLAESDFGKYRAMEMDVNISWLKGLTESDTKRGDENPRKPAYSKQEAMQEFVKQLENHKGDDGKPSGFSSYSTGTGDYFLEGIKVFGFVKGTSKHFMGGEIPTIYAIAENKEAYQWYIEALEVVEEVCDYVLAQDDPENYFFHWSG